MIDDNEKYGPNKIPGRMRGQRTGLGLLQHLGFEWKQKNQETSQKRVCEVEENKLRSNVIEAKMCEHWL